MRPVPMQIIVAITQPGFVGQVGPKGANIADAQSGGILMERGDESPCTATR